jgi:CheY-like chemotaxis protein/HPt (histidine-containing phosphotransfer) domain-containing protein
VIVNLGGNAIKFTDDGEVVIDVTEKSRPDGQIILQCSVKDTGVGIPTEKHALIFDPFSQADVSTTRQFGGTGLGLSISSQLVEMMKGEIWLESELGQGSTFHFTATMETSDAQPQRLPPGTQVLTGLKALVVDDNATNRRVLEEMLRIWGLNVLAADGAETAMGLSREAASSNEPFQLVLLDLMMPNIDGFTLAEQIQSDASLGDPEMIMISSAGRSGDMERCRQLGIAKYLMKPIIQSELLNAMLEIFAASAAAEPDAHPIAGPRLRVLLAEDGLINQQVAIGLLRRYGHEVVVANNGKEAVQAMESGSFDVVLMDVQMPEMDGHAATTAIRNLEKGSSRHTPIIAMTAAAMKGDREQCLESGMDGYLAKPINPDQLLQTLLQFVPASEQVTAASQHDPSGDAEVLDDELMPDPENLDFVDIPAAMDLVPGGIEAFQRFTQTVLTECSKMMDEIRSGLAEQDAPRLRRGAHTLKGTAGIFGAKRVVNVALRIEALARDGDLIGAQGDLEELDFEVDRMCEAIKTAANSTPSAG